MEDGCTPSTCTDDINIHSRNTNNAQPKVSRNLSVNINFDSSSHDSSSTSTTSPFSSHPIMKRSGSNRCLSDSILHSYERSQSENRTLGMQSSASTPAFYSPRKATGILSNSGWGPNASFNIVQRSAAAKEEIRVSISKMKECVNMIRNNSVHVPHSHSPSPSQADTELTQFCAQLIRQNISTLAICVQDDYYRIVAGNMDGIETIIDTMNIFSCDENLTATCNLTLGILCLNSAHHQMKLMDANGLDSIIASIRNFPTSEKVCSTSVDALVNITTKNENVTTYLCQILDLEHILNSTNDYLYPLSRQNKNILLRNIQTHG